MDAAINWQRNICLIQEQKCLGRQNVPVCRNVSFPAANKRKKRKVNIMQDSRRFPGVFINIDKKS
ncbi:hypothetical protein AAJCM20276_13770 [Acetobacter aceti]|uniref:Uncharacterized protein n=1 Tax=Acetobacter aceti TaxID=435 RepID=A0A6S6PHI1_ACEAC|nr:hypothetical protein AAJCM20276_13770 [Acetobacter aceti]